MNKTTLGKFLKQRKEFITINDNLQYKRCRVQVNRKGVVLRDVVLGSEIKTKKQQLCKNGDFIVAEIDAKVGGYGFITSDLDGAIVSSHYYLFEIDSSILLPDFLNILIKTNIIQNQINAQGSTNYSSVRPKEILEIQIPDLSLEEQKSIVTKYDSISNLGNRLKVKLNEKNEIFSLLKKSIFNDAFQGKLVPQMKDEESVLKLIENIKQEKEKFIRDGSIKKEFRNLSLKQENMPYVIPNTWEWVRLEDISLKIHYGYTASADFNITKSRLLRITDIQNNKVNWATVPGCEITDKEKSKYLLTNNDILIARTGGTIGKTYLVKDLTVDAVFASYLIRIIPSSLINVHYLKFFLESPLYWHQLTSLSMGTGQPNVSATSLKSLLIPIPPLKEQIKIVDKLDKIMGFCIQFEEKTNKSQKNLDRLLQVVLQGFFDN